MHDESILFQVISVDKNEPILTEIKILLASVELDVDSHVHHFIIAKLNDKIIACAGIDANVIKCVAVDSTYQGLNITPKLMQHVLNFAHEQGQTHLFLYTKPDNADFFKSCGFYPLVEVPNTLVLMENTPIGIASYCKKLSPYKKTGICGAIVMNANPFTRGHLYLAEQASKSVDWVYIFVVSEDASEFPADVRYLLVKEGVSHLSNVTVLPGSEYIVSKATFPTYFLKDKTLVEQAYMAVDLSLFRQYIAPALSISRRYVGTEPHSEITKAYNHAMMHWLQDKNILSAAPIEVIEIPRVKSADDVISASRVRALLAQKKHQEIETLVPDSTWAYIKQHYS